MTIFKKIWNFLFNQSTITTVTDPVPVQKCLCYSVQGSSPSGPSFAVDYKDCMGDSQSAYVNPGQVVSFCALEKTVITGAFIASTSPCGDKCGICDPTISPA